VTLFVAINGKDNIKLHALTAAAMSLGVVGRVEYARHQDGAEMVGSVWRSWWVRGQGARVRLIV